MDINCDLGESFGAWSIGNDAAVMPYITSANVACGFHAGDFSTMLKTVSLCLNHGVKIGAHPGYPDLQGFGRRKMHFHSSEVHALVLYQIGALDAMVKAKGGTLRHVKPHGALYNQAANDEELADAIISAVQAYNSRLVVYGLSGSLFVQMAKQRGLTAMSEVFADRAYTQDGQLADRALEGAVLSDQSTIQRQVHGLVHGLPIETIDKKTIRLNAETICIHGDGSRAVETARWVKEAVL